jgi:Right handed beta helix region
MKRLARLLALLPFVCATTAQAKLTEITILIENLAPENGTYLTPFWVGLHNGNFDTHTLGVAASAQLERLAEDGNPQTLMDAFAAHPSGLAQGVAATDDGVPPLAPGESAEISFIVDSDDFKSRFFSYASMVIPSNDAFIGNDDAEAHRIFDVDGDFLGAFLTIDGDEVKDAGTELNDEFPDHTAFFGQSEPDTGIAENGVVHLHPGFLPYGSGGILDDPMFAEADFTQPGYQMARIIIVRSDTIVPGGAVSGTWTKRDSPFIVTGDIVVPYGETLTIEPGVLVVFENVFSLIVEGTLIAEGLEDDPITFTAQTDTAGWRGLRFFYAPDGSHLEHCILEYGLVMAASPFDRGAALYIENSNPVIERCTLRYNRALKSGGAVYMVNSSPVLRENLITENMTAYPSSSTGGAISVVDSTPQIIDNVIVDNLAYGYNVFSGGSARGAGIYMNDSGGVVDGNIIANNFIDAGGNISSHGQGAGIACYYSDPLISNNTFYKNEISLIGASAEGGGVYAYFSPARIVNNIFLENEGGAICIDGFSQPTVEYNDFYNNPDGTFQGDVPVGLGDIVTTNHNGDPADVFFNIFLNPELLDAPGGIYDLSSSSPAIDAGAPDTPSDPDGTIADVGARYFEQVLAGDLNGDGCVDQADLGILLAAYGVGDGGDIDGDGDTDQADLGSLLANYGQGC